VETAAKTLAPTPVFLRPEESESNAPSPTLTLSVPVVMAGNDASPTDKLLPAELRLIVAVPPTL
jgi:hypothetical protein